MTTALVVDDSATDRHLAGSILRKNSDIVPIYARDGEEALTAIERGAPDVVITDMLMPGMNGLELLKAIQRAHPAMPVILVTAYGSEEIVIEALHAGAASYVPKRNVARDLVRTAERVVSAAVAARREREVLIHVMRSESDFCLDSDPRHVRPLISHLEECFVPIRLCTQADQIRVASALHEALDNALYHGNLEMDSSERDKGEDTYRALAEERRQQLPYRDRRIHVSAKYDHAQTTFIIRDEGPGFDPSTVPDPTDPANIAKSNGRGLLLIRSFMDSVTHSETGNEITMTRRHRGADERKPGPDAATRQVVSTEVT